MPAAKAKSKIGPVDQLQLTIHAGGGQAHDLALGEAAAWCWRNMVEPNTVTVFVQGEGGAEIEGVCTVTFKDGAMRVKSSAPMKPKWVAAFEELVA